MAGFPVFIEVGRTAPLIVGGGNVAAIKARLLLRRADRLTFAADAVVPAIRELVDQGKADLIGGGVGEAQLRGRPLVISATGNDDEDRRVSELARAMGVPVNVPDRPELCSFSLAAIVDRGLVTIAIGTEGAAPVLATRLRAKLEQELSPRLGALAQVAREFRDQVGKLLPEGAARRAFWDRVFGGPAADAILDGDEKRGRALIESALLDSDQPVPQGRVYLVGAGPGDPELLTLKGVRALKDADVILTDFLVGDGVLDHARREAEIICVGKAKGRHSRSQAEINAMIVSLASQGKTVVRLKGGDPFLFGRGGEEVDTLRASGIACEVIPGVTAATAAAASVQIPLTQRDLSRSVTFISGHAAGDGVPDFDNVDFRALSKGGNTLAVYMAVSTAGKLGEALLRAGWSAATPVMAVERATRSDERRVLTTLDVLAGETESLNLKGPAILICGEVAGLTPVGAVEEVLRRAQPPCEPGEELVSGQEGSK